MKTKYEIPKRVDLFGRPILQQDQWRLRYRDLLIEIADAAYRNDDIAILYLQLQLTECEWHLGDDI